MLTIAITAVGWVETFTLSHPSLLLLPSAHQGLTRRLIVTVSGVTPQILQIQQARLGYSQLPANWAATTGVTQILNKPTLSVVSATGSYADLLNVPIISTAGRSGLYSDRIGQPVISTVGHTGNYTDLLGQHN